MKGLFCLAGAGVFGVVIKKLIRNLKLNSLTQLLL